jgi:hypothetical protein
MTRATTIHTFDPDLSGYSCPLQGQARTLRTACMFEESPEQLAVVNPVRLQPQTETFDRHAEALPGSLTSRKGQ